MIPVPDLSLSIALTTAPIQGRRSVCTDVTSCLSSASNHLPQQQTLGKTGRSPLGSSSKVSQLHLPHLPTRHAIKHLSLAVTRANGGNTPRQVPASGRGGGTGRREAVTASRDVPRTPVSSLLVTTNAHTTRQSANLRSDARTYARSSATISRDFRVPHVTASKVS